MTLDTTSKRRSSLTWMLPGLALLFLGMKPVSAQTVTVLHRFLGFPQGEALLGRPVQARDGNFYGATGFGGIHASGEIYKITPSGTKTVLYSFEGSSDGYFDYNTTIQGTDGNFYGTTFQGGTYTNGTVFKLSTGGTKTILHSFVAATDGTDLHSGVTQASNGNFYGTASEGGVNGFGTLYQLTASGTFTVLHTFKGTDGAQPIGDLLQASDGALYGTTSAGGANGNGTIFKITTTGTYTLLYSFSVRSTTWPGGNTDGANPYAGLIQGKDGSLYGGTYSGGTSNLGAIFKVTTTGKFTPIYSFSGTDGDACNALLQASDGNFYGTTSGSFPTLGTVFKLTATGTLTTLHTFTGEDGAYPQSALIQAKDGNLYGVTYKGGAGYRGSFYKITTAGKMTPLYSSEGSDDGVQPEAPVVQATNGVFYGTTPQGGTYNNGVVFSLTSDGTYTTLYSFTFNDGNFQNADGYQPEAGLIQAKDGDLYGTTQQGGTTGGGVVYKLTSSGEFTTLHSFDTPNEGGAPQAALVQGSDGNFYGTASAGGVNGLGTLFKMDSAGDVTVLHAFAGGNEGADPAAALVQIGSNFYGTTVSGGANGLGTLFKITSKGVFTTLYSFAGSDGANPYGPLVKASNGLLYGMTSSGGSNGLGTLFKITTGGKYTLLASFAGSNGASPRSGLVQASDGNLYGLTYSGGQYGAGVIFRLTLAGILTPLYSLNSNTEGYLSFSNLIEGSDGNLYGETRGVQDAEGDVFRFNSALPILIGFSPAKGAVGTTVTISGVNFTNVKSVKFNSRSASFTVNSNLNITATVPSGAKTGKITVTTANGTATSAVNFTVTP